jgi:hypothetical protein
MSDYPIVEQWSISVTEESISMWWNSDVICDFLWYSTNNGQSWHGVSISADYTGQYEITGLSSNATYQIKTRVRAKDSGLVSESEAEEVTTYSWPYAKEMPDFTIGDKLTIKLYNPMFRQVTINLIGADGSVVSTDTTYNQQISGYAGDSVVEALYNSIPDAPSGSYSVRVTYGTHVSVKSGGHYLVNQNVCAPSIEAASYQDTNSATIAITGNNQDLVKNKSVPSYTATGLESKKGASIESVSVSVNGTDVPLSISGTSATGTGAALDSATNIEAVFTVTDSRGLTSTKIVSLTMLDWFDPLASISVKRQGNTETDTNLYAKAVYAPINGNNSVTITYEATKDGDSSPSVSGTLTDGVVSVASLDNTYAWTVEITLTDLLGGSTTYTAEIAKGVPLVFFDKLRSSVGVGCFPDNDNSVEIVGELIVGGKKLIFNSDHTVTWANP